jgi:PAS domain S-box-containing protein
MSRPTLSTRAAALALVSVASIALTAALALYSASLHRENVALGRFQAAFHRLVAASHAAPEPRTEAAFRAVDAHVLEARAALDEVRSDALRTRLSDEVAAFERAFAVMEGAHRQRGIDEDSGIEGTFRRNAHAIGAAVRGQPTLRTALLEMRRSEKDFIMRRDPAYIARVRAYADTLRAALGQSGLGEAERDRLAVLTDSYVTSFESLAVSFDTIDAARGALVEAERDIEAYVAARIEASQRNSSWALAALLAVLVAGIAGALIAASFLHRHVLRPLRQLGGAAERIGQPGAAAGVAPMAFHETNALRVTLERSAHHVAAQRAAEANSRTAARFLRSIIGGMAGGLIVTDREGHVLMANPVVAALAGRSADDFVGLRVPDVLPVDAALHRSTLGRVFGGESVDLGDRSFAHPSGTIWYTGTASPIADDQGHVQYAVYALVDLTERKRHEIELAHAQREAEGVARLKSALLDNLSHELRTPLSAIIGYSDILMLEAEGEQLEFAHAIREAGQHQLRLLSDLLDYSQAAAGTLPPPSAASDLREAVWSAIRPARALAERKGLAFEVDLPGAAPIRADGSALRSIAAKLIDNAVKFTSEGGVSVRLSVDAGHARLEVEDTGPGIDAAFRPFLFDEFRQQSGGLQRAHGGLGLGLALARRYAEHLGGQISYTSEPGVGTTFVVELPHAHATPARAQKAMTA